jgi:putative hydrolase of the HAD superfamily
MDITAVAFDANGTLVKILADDDEERVFRAAAHFLTYQGIALHRHELRDLYFQIRKEQLRTSPERYPEFDAAGIWRAIITTHGTDFTRALPAGKLQQMPLFLAEMSRGISRRRLGLYPHVREVLDILRERYPLAIITDAQSTSARGELHKVGLLGYFDPVIVSGDHGYRKPDRRLFQLALSLVFVQVSGRNWVRTSDPSLVSVGPLGGSQDQARRDLRKPVRQGTRKSARVRRDCRSVSHSGFA